MIRHVVFIRFKADTPEATRAEAVDQLRDLPRKIDVVKKFDVGRNIMPAERAWDVVLIGEYDDLAALDAYDKHPAHAAVVAMMRPIAAAIGSVDYEF